MRLAECSRPYGVAELRELADKFKAQATAEMVRKPAIANGAAKEAEDTRAARRKKKAVLH